MGDAKRKQMNRKLFLALPENRRCCYCGAPATTIDHFPPRNIFRERKYPEGYIYPCCEQCNSSKSNDEQSISFLLCIMDWNSEREEGNFLRLYKAVKNNHPKLLTEFQKLPRTRSKKILRHRLGSQYEVMRQGRSDWIAVTCGPETTRLLKQLCIWFAQTGYFKHNQKLFRGEVFSSIIPSEFLREEQFWVIVRKLSGMPIIFETGHNISNQFFYRYFSTDGGFFSIFQFGSPQLLFIVCAISEDHLKEDREIPSGWHRSGLVGPEL